VSVVGCGVGRYQLQDGSGSAAAYRLRKLPDPKRLERIARPWRPYRTLACLYLWSSLDNTAT
jgi:3-methyladenine DNA glycosylase/8-oxoguanine DNA glycosylase